MNISKYEIKFYSMQLFHICTFVYPWLVLYAQGLDKENIVSEYKKIRMRWMFNNAWNKSLFPYSASAGRIPGRLSIIDKD